jgi:hypothetical protein
VGVYRDLIAAVFARVSAVGLFASASPPVPVVRYKRPAWNSKQHRSITVIVAGKDDYAEELDPQGEAFERGAGLVFPVWVGLVHDERFDDATRDWFLDGREAVREAVWDLSVLDGVPGAYDVGYDPSGSGAKRGGEGRGGNAPNLDESWQLFRFSVALVRTGLGGR